MVSRIRNILNLLFVWFGMFSAGCSFTIPSAFYPKEVRRFFCFFQTTINLIFWIFILYCIVGFVQRGECYRIRHHYG
jgi:hypothetical protein